MGVFFGQQRCLNGPLLKETSTCILQSRSVVCARVPSVPSRRLPSAVLGQTVLGDTNSLGTSATIGGVGKLWSLRDHKAGAGLDGPA